MMPDKWQMRIDIDLAESDLWNAHIDLLREQEKHD